MGYLGKISAVVSVNTGDFAGKLNRCKGDVESFAASTMRSMANASRSSAKSFGSIYTEVQKLERALRAASTLKLDFTGLKGFEGKGLQEAVDQMRQMHSIASQLSAPLSKVVASVDAMSDAIKSTLHGAMVQAQADVEHLQTKMQTVGSVTAQEFEEAERKVRSFAAAAKMAAEATQGAASMGGGSSFRFKNPGLSDEFNRGGQLFGKVNALPAGRVTSELVKLIDLQKSAAAEAVKLTAEMAASPSQAAAYGLEATQKALADVNDSIEKVIQSYAAMDAAEADAAAKRAEADAKWATLGPAGERARSTAPLFASLGANVKRAAEDATGQSEDIRHILAFQKQEKDAKKAAADKASADAKAKSDAETLLRLEQNRLQIMTGEAQSVSQLDSEYKGLLSRVEKLSAAQRASVQAVVDTNGAMVELAISSGTDADVGAVKAEMAAIEGAVASAEDLDKQQKAAKKSADDLLSLQQGYAQSLSGQSQNIAQLRSTYDGLISRFEKLSAAQRATLAAGGFSISADKVQQTLASGDETKVAATQTAVMSMESAISAVEALDAQQKAAKKSADDLRSSLSKIGDSIGTPAAPIDQAREAIDRMNAAVDKIKDPAKKAKAAGIAAGIRKDIETEVAISAATGTAPASSVISDAAKKANSLADAADAVNNKKTSKDIFGDVVGSRASQMDQVKSKIKGIHSELEKLPVSLQTKFAPELVKVRTLYMNLTPSSTKTEIEAAAKAAKLLGDSIERTAQSQKFSGSFANFLDDTSAKKYEAELNAVQSKMAAVGATASGPTAQAIGKYRDALEKAAMAGTLGSDATRDSMQDLIAEIEKAVVAEGKLTAAQAKAVFGGIKREGDIGRGGVDKFGLALNQAAYAVDDFMSSTGGIEQKIRAISNNVTQLAFIIGSTTGLWIGLGAVVAAQAAIMAYKFANGGKAAEDTSKALNEALQKQKSIVQELASAYKDLSNEMKLSAPAQAGAANATALGGIKAANEEFRRSRLMGVNADVVGEVATQASIDRRMQSATTVGELAYRNELRRQSAARQNAAEATARRGVPGAAGNLDEMKEKRRAVASQIGQDFESQFYDLIGAPTWSGRFRELSGILADLESQIRATEDSMVELANSASEASFASAQTAAARIESASNLLATAIERGVPGAMAFQSSLDSLAMEMSGALKSIGAAAAVEDPRQRSTAIAAAQAGIADITRRTAGVIEQTLRPRIDAAFAGPTAGDALGQVAAGPRGARMRASLVMANERAAVEKEKYGNAATRSAAARAEQTRIRLEGERRVRESFSAGVELQNDAVYKESNTRFFSKEEIATARAKANAAGDEYRAQVRQAEAASQAAQASVDLADAARETARADYEAAQAASRLQAAIQATSQAMEEFAGRTRKIAEDAMAASSQTADSAQRRFTDNPTEENRRARDEAERQMIADKERIARADAMITQKMSDIQSDPVIAKANAEVRAIDEQIARMQATQANTGVPMDAAAMRDAENRRAAAVADRERRQFDLTAPERAAADAEAQGIARRQKIEELRQQAPERRAAERARVNQGREDAMTSRERRVLEAARSSENMAAAAGEFTNPAARQAFIQQYYANQKKEILQSGPLGQAADERFNAQFTTRRIGMDATDISTMEGSRELNRLLRGDDANKDVNFAEMQRQTELLSDIRDGIMASTGTPVIP